MSRDLSALFRPFRLKSLRLANRIVMSPMGRNFARVGWLEAIIAITSVGALPVASRSVSARRARSSIRSRRQT